MVGISDGLKAVGVEEVMRPYEKRSKKPFSKRSDLKTEIAFDGCARTKVLNDVWNGHTPW